MDILRADFWRKETEEEAKVGQYGVRIHYVI